MTNKEAAQTFDEGEEIKVNLHVVPATEEPENPNNPIVNLRDINEEDEQIKITPQSAIERIAAISEVPKLAKYARTLAKHGIIVVAKGVPYDWKGAMTPAEGVEGSQDVINDLLAKKKVLTANPPVKKPIVPKVAKPAVTKSEEELLRELLNKAVGKISESKDLRQLEERAYALHQAGVIIKTNTETGYSVKTVEGVKDSEVIVSLINLRKKALQVEHLIRQAEKADNKQDVLKVFRQAVIRSFLNENRTANPNVPNADKLLEVIRVKMNSVKKEKPLTCTISEALKKF